MEGEAVAMDGDELRAWGERLVRGLAGEPQLFRNYRRLDWLVVGIIDVLEDFGM